MYEACVRLHYPCLSHTSTTPVQMLDESVEAEATAKNGAPVAVPVPQSL